MEKLKRELPYYDECNTAGIEMFRNWANARRSLRIEEWNSIYKYFPSCFPKQKRKLLFDITFLLDVMVFLKVL